MLLTFTMTFGGVVVAASPILYATRRDRLILLLGVCLSAAGLLRVLVHG